jgi:hypothetical protein
VPGREAFPQGLKEHFSTGPRVYGGEQAFDRKGRKGKAAKFAKRSMCVFFAAFAAFPLRPSRSKAFVFVGVALVVVASSWLKQNNARAPGTISNA